ncbi:stalk domain-containing protein [Paenibacillus sp. SI8]|uniref:stalk domain-containing protein n=1 Tax=unclassified Paenibacillus TaxID=185978 RepID=UPI003465F970
MKKILTVAISLCFISSTVNASSSHGDFEGNPIVSVQSNGKNIQTEDVPAINYKGRTMVPIYMLKQLGADVVWNDSTYSVNVSIDKSKDTKTDSNTITTETQSLRDAYQWLNDTDVALWMFTVKLQQYKDNSDASNISQIIDNDFLDISKQYDESMKFALKIAEKNSNSHIQDIMSVQSKAFDQVKQTKELLKVWLTVKSDAQITSTLKFSMINTLQSTQKNVENTKSYIHELMVQDIE